MLSIIEMPLSLLAMLATVVSVQGGSYSNELPNIFATDPALHLDHEESRGVCLGFCLGFWFLLNSVLDILRNTSPRSSRANSDESFLALLFF